MKISRCRFEFKYLLNHSQYNAIKNDVMQFMSFDPNSCLDKNNHYIVRSLYFDDPKYTDFYDKTEGIKKRGKFRVRCYLNDNKPHYFLEKKSRNDQKVFKTRERLIKAGIEQNVTQNILSHIGCAPLFDEFAFHHYRRFLKPNVLIDYRREAFQYGINADLRVTFDSHLTAFKSSKLEPQKSCVKRCIVPGQTVMEVKFVDSFPSWLHRIFISYQLNRISFSKICHGIEGLGLAEDL